MQTADRIALVTGANKGIGFETARQLAQAGATVVIGARDEERGQAAVDRLRQEGLGAGLLVLDVLDAASIRAVADEIEAQYGRLDTLVNNVGVFAQGDTVPSSTSLAIVRMSMETNFFGTLAVTQAMLPLLRRSDAGRIVNLSSSCGSIAGNGEPSSPFYAAQYIGYNASKAALNMLTVQLAQELRETNIVVTSVCPGFVNTDLNGHTGQLTASEAAQTPVHYATIGADAASGRFMDRSGAVAW